MTGSIHFRMAEMVEQTFATPHCFILSHEAMTEYVAWRDSASSPYTLPEMFRGASVSAHFDPNERDNYLVCSGYGGITIEAFR